MFLTTEDTENTEMKKVKLRFIRGYANATHADLTQVKNIPQMILIAIVYYQIYINALILLPRLQKPVHRFEFI